MESEIISLRKKMTEVVTEKTASGNEHKTSNLPLSCTHLRDSAVTEKPGGVSSVLRVSVDVSLESPVLENLHP